MTKKMHKIKRRWKAADFRRLLAAMRKPGQSVRALCRLAEYPSYNTIYLYMQSNPDFKRAYDEALAAAKKPDDARRQELHRRRMAGQSMRQIGEHFGVSAMSVCKWLRKYNIPAPEKCAK